MERVELIRMPGAGMPDGETGKSFRISALTRLVAKNDKFSTGMWSRDSKTGDWVLVGLLKKEPKPKKKTAQDMPYRASIMNRVDRQSEKGLQKYGGFLTDNKWTTQQRLEHLAEELTDGLVYIEDIRADMQNLTGQMIDLMGDLTILALECQEDMDRGRYYVSDKILEAADAVKNIVEWVTGHGKGESGRTENLDNPARVNG